MSQILNMFNIKKYDKYAKFLSYASIVLFEFFYTISTSTFYALPYIHDLFYNIIKLSLVMIFIVDLYYFLTKRYYKYEIILGAILGVIFAYTYYITREAKFIIAILYAYAFIDLDIDKTIKYIFFSLIAGFLVVYITWIAGISSDASVIGIRYGAERLRYSLGFNYTCIGAHLFLFIVLQYIYLLKDNYKLLNFIIINIFNILVFYATDTKTVFLLVLLMSIYAFFYKKHEIFKYVFIISFFTIIIFTVLYAYFPDTFGFLNRIFTGRLQLTVDYIKDSGIHLLPKFVVFIGGNPTPEYNYVDPSYMQLILRSGIIVTIIIILLLTLLTFEAYNDKWFVFVLIFVAIRAIVDDRLMDINFNPWLIFLFKFIREDPSKILKKLGIKKK